MIIMIIIMIIIIIVIIIIIITRFSLSMEMSRLTRDGTA